ncbi:MAG TPA: nucleoid-associated protein, partial [Clostridium sp.]
MDYINDINITEAVIHILDSNGEDPVLNEYNLQLDDDTYKFLFKHMEKCLKDEELKYAKFNSERNIVKEIVQDYLNGIDDTFIDLSKELARQLFLIMKGNVNIPSCDLVVASIITDQGPMIAMLKMDYVKNFTHEVEFVENKIGIGIVPQSAGLPASNQKIQKAAFIKPI